MKLQVASRKTKRAIVKVVLRAITRVRREEVLGNSWEVLVFSNLSNTCFVSSVVHTPWLRQVGSKKNGFSPTTGRGAVGYFLGTKYHVLNFELVFNMGGYTLFGGKDI